MDDEPVGREANKVCGVCGDRALGYNFNAVSCESCKAFFRRNALKNKDFRCPFTENCEITVVTRRFCQKCRLDKCFNIGMRKEYIMSEEDKVLKRQKIEQNRAKKRPQSENPKTSKMKRESLDDSANFENETASVASVASESYIWESDRKYTDLDGNNRQQQVVDSLSPVTAASVPSPSSPPESANITGSKTLEMLKESKYEQDSAGNHFGRSYEEIESGYEQGDTNPEESLRHEKRHGGQSPIALRLDHHLPRFGGTGVPGSSRVERTILNCTKFDQQLDRLAADDSSFDQDPPGSSKLYDPRFDGNLSSSSRLDHDSSSHPDQKPSSTYSGSSMGNRIVSDSNLSLNDDQQSCTPIDAQKAKENCSKGNSLLARFIQDPNLIAKFLSNPIFAMKVFQDQGLVTKIMTDPDTVTRLASDPQIARFLEENDVTSTEESLEGQQQTGIARTETEFDRTLANNGISDNMIRHMLEGDRKQIENPILTNLITNKNAEKCKNQSVESGTGGDWVKSTEDVTRDVLQDVQRIPIAANSIESILCEAIKLEFSAYSTLGGNQNSRELNDAERAKLNELIVANKALLAPLDDDITNLVGEDCRFKGNAGQSDPMLLDVINLTAIAIRRLIKMSKKINAFKNMCQEDQLALLKGGCTEMMILRSAINYDPDKDMWKIPHSQERMSKIKVDVLKEAKGNLYSEHARFVRTFDPRWRDENIILILSAIALFTPDRPRVVHSDVIKLEQNSYYYLLRRYLESVYPGCEAKSTFLKLIQKISELHRLNDEVVGVYLNVNPSSVEPLLIEIFDLMH